MNARHPRSLVRALAALAGLAATAAASDCNRTSVGHTPLSDLGTGLYLGQFEGGLYPGGVNAPPQAHAAAGITRASAVQPRRPQGQPDPSGRYILLSIGMSNTTQEFCGGGSCTPWSFSGQAAADPRVNHVQLAIVDGAAGGRTAAAWDQPTDPDYDRVRDQVLRPRNLSEAQVQAVWVKVANARPTVSLPAPQADAYTLVAQMGGIARALRTRYPNVQVVFFSSRIYAGYATTTLNPEPYAYESAFAVKWLIEAQIRQMQGGGIDPRAGDLNHTTLAPWIAWGPYLWADGLTPRSDGLTWRCEDLEQDGTHPSQSGEEKVGNMLLRFMLNSPFAAPWFRIAGAPCYADCDTTTGAGTLDVFDFLCFQNRFARREPYACDCDTSTGAGVCDIFDFTCFQNAFAAGCP